MMQREQEQRPENADPSTWQFFQSLSARPDSTTRQSWHALSTWLESSSSHDETKNSSQSSSFFFFFSPN
jgi:hypothetical protein